MLGTSDVDELFTASYRRLMVWLAGLRVRSQAMLRLDLGPCSSDGRCEFVERGGQLEHRRGVDCQLVVATTRSGQRRVLGSRRSPFDGASVCASA